MKSAFICIRSVTKHYQMGGLLVRALDGLDIEIPKNSFTVVMGPSGSGKSTLLHLLGGLDRPTSGQIEFLGQRLDEMDENQLALFRRKAVGFIFQSFNLIQSMTAAENVGFPMQFAGIPPKERTLASLELINRVGLSDRAHHRPSELSGGQQQRVAIARALVNGPSILLADEPTGNLDSKAGLEVLDLLARLNLERRVTILLATHSQEAAAYAHRLIRLRDGTLLRDEP
jgi:putative ABC transport system ATP-binding protein